MRLRWRGPCKPVRQCDVRAPILPVVGEVRGGGPGVAPRGGPQHWCVAAVVCWWVGTAVALVLHVGGAKRIGGAKSPCAPSAPSLCRRGERYVRNEAEEEGGGCRHPRPAPWLLRSSLSCAA